jgi:hypothetical protein
MKIFKTIFLATLAVFALVTSCKDEDQELVPVWETAVHGNAVLAEGSADGFIYKDPSKEVTIELQWISIDNLSQVTKIEVYTQFNESYVDVDGNPKTVKHGGDQGLLLASFEGAEVPGNRQAVSFTANQANLYEIYKDATFDYGSGEVPVFSNPAKPERTATDRFVPEDAFKIRWEFTTADGRLFSAWGVSVCTEFPDANCSVDFAVSCAPEIVNPGANGGVYTIEMTDTYGDGWNGAAIRVIIDGVETDYTIDDGASAVTLVTVPPTATTLTFEFVSGDWDSEVIYAIKSPKGNVIAKAGPSPAEGPIKLNLCKE